MFSYQVVDVDFGVSSGNQGLEISVTEHPEPVQADDVGQPLPEGLTW